MKKNIISISLIASLVLGSIGIILTNKFPFGLIFNFSLYVSLVSLIGLSVYTVLKLFKGSAIKKIISVLISVLIFILISIVIISFIDIRILIPSVSARTITKEEWVDDFDFLDKSLQKHPAYNDSLSYLVDLYKSEIQSLSEVSDYKGFITAMRMVSLFKDGHSNFMPFQLYMRTRYLPIQIYDFEDGIFITGSTNQDFIGGRIVSINNHSIDSVIKKITPLIGADNSVFAKYQSSLYIPNMDVLKALDITYSTEQVELKIMINDELITEKLESISMIKWLYWSFAPNDDKWPVGHNIRNTDSRIEVINDSLIWMTFNKTGPEDVLTDIGNKIINREYGKEINHIVIDMRNNTGGDNTTYNDFIKSLSKSPIDITLLTSRKTFSAGINFISELKLVRDFKIIGEPTGAGHNHYGDSQIFFLTNSGLMFSLSTRKWSFIPQLKDNTILPDVAVSYSSSEYFQHEDPWLKALDNNSKKQSE